jgi:hypothetical protein
MNRLHDGGGRYAALMGAALFMLAVLGFELQHSCIGRLH